MVKVATVHKRRANVIRWRLLEDGQALSDPWWQQITRLVLRVGDVVVDSDSADPHVMKHEDGVLQLRLGLLDIPEGRYQPELVVHTVSDLQGIEWDGLPVVMVRD